MRNFWKGCWNKCSWMTKKYLKNLNTTFHSFRSFAFRIIYSLLKQKKIFEIILKLRASSYGFTISYVLIHLQKKCLHIFIVQHILCCRGKFICMRIKFFIIVTKTKLKRVKNMKECSLTARLMLILQACYVS